MFSDYDLTLLMLLFMRMTGCIVFNPIFSRRNVPVLLRIGLTAAMTYFTYGLVPPQQLPVASPFAMLLVLAVELLVGWIIGFIINLFMSVIIIAGEIMDMQMAISMAKIYDPGSNISMPISASLYNSLFVIVFFITNSHLTLIKIFTALGYVIPYDGSVFSPDAFKYAGLLFTNILIYAIKMTLPILVAEILAEVTVGVMMKAVPQINIFVVNLQIKVFIGFMIMLFIVSPMAIFFENLISYMFDSINKVFEIVAMS